MLETGLPVSQEIRFEELVLAYLTDSYLGITRIAQLNLLIPTFLTYAVLALKGVYAGHIDAQVRQGHRDSGVARRLTDERTHRQVPRTIGETLRITDRTGFGVLRIQLAVVITVDIAAVVSAGREVDAGREGSIRIGFAILLVRP